MLIPLFEGLRYQTDNQILGSMVRFPFLFLLAVPQFAKDPTYVKPVGCVQLQYQLPSQGLMTPARLTGIAISRCVEPVTLMLEVAFFDRKDFQVDTRLVVLPIAPGAKVRLYAEALMVPAQLPKRADLIGASIVVRPSTGP